MNDLVGRTALVTGSTHGIGREVAVALAAAGARVAVHGRSAEAAAEVATLLARDDRHAGTFLADLADSAAVEHLIAEVGRRLP
ncbi:MAG: SDR family NAD(P)-dependent oxidoreductase, partial [Planctomycetia bacterium]